MSKTIEEIRNQVAKENAFDDWEDLCFCHGEMTSIKRFENLTKFFDEVAERYAQSQTQELIEQNKELVNSLSKLVLLLDEIDGTLFHHNHSIDGWHLNGDLEPIMNFVNDMDLEPVSEAKELLTKYNHLNQM